MNCRNFKYILGLATCMLSSCHDDEVFDTLSGTAEKTPLMVSTNLNLSGSVQTRAVDKVFEKNDEFMACIRHVIDDNGISEVLNDSPTADFHPRAYATFRVVENPSATDQSGINVYDYGQDFTLKSLKYGTTTLTESTTHKAALYWDDFSNSGPEDTDLRTENHGLQSYYAYCFNGATPLSDGGTYSLLFDTGVLTWQIQTEQNNEEKFKNSDLLWSTIQDPVQYFHGDTHGSSHNDLNIPFSHAMSKITINVNVDESFVKKDNLFKYVNVYLKNFRTSCVLTPNIKNGSVSYLSSTSAESLTMRNISSAPYNVGCFEAIVVPSELVVGNKFATIRVDGNDYNIPVTDAMVKSPSSATDNGWGEKLTLSSAKYQMHQGVNYVLNVTLKKTKIGVSAMILDWDSKFADGKGDIIFEKDVTDIQIAPELKDVTGSFKLWYSTTSSYSNEQTTTVIYDGGSWKTDSEIYWENSTQPYYFRALAKYIKVEEQIQVYALDGNPFVVNQGFDYVWGTTSKHTGTFVGGGQASYNEGDPIDPRIGKVPMTFYHQMSMITVTLETVAGAAAVDLSGAKISISNLYTSGKIAIGTGIITPTESKTGNAIDKVTEISKYPVIPQTIGNESIMTITLADGTTYKLQLNKCESEVTDAGGEVSTICLTQWEKRTHYKYTIHLEKEKITFRAMIKEWEEKTGSGNATLDWD